MLLSSFFAKNNSADMESTNLSLSLLSNTNGLLRWRGEGKEVEGSIVELTKNKLISC